MPEKKIAVIVGSLRRESLNRKMAQVLRQLAPDGLSLEIIEIGSLPLYNQDLDENPPPEWTEFRAQVSPCDGVLFVTPEYNRSVPGVLKNAVDVGSRPYGKSVWNAKPCAVLSVSPGALGGFGANHHLRQSLVSLNMPTMPGPELYIGGASKIFDAKGDIPSADTRKLLQGFIDGFAKWVATNAPH
jgi:chromate reductase